MKGACTALFLGVLMLAVCGCARLQRRPGPETEPSDSKAVPTVTQARLVYDGFAVLDFRAIRDEHNRVHVVGEVKNVSTAARGVELQATLRDSQGRIVAVGNFYPASNHNMAPGETWPFSYSFGRYDTGIRVELRIVGAFRTIETVSGVMRP